MRKFHAILLALVFLIAGLLIGARTALNNAILTSDLDADGHKIINLPPDQPLPPPTLGASIPPTWLGTTSTTAAQGNLAEFLSHKAQPDGYASLDGTGKVPSAQIPAGVGTGSVTSVSVTTANGVSGTVVDASTTPAITLSLGAITPTSSFISATDGSGYIQLAGQSTDPTTPVVGGAKIWVDDSGRLSWGTNTNWVKFAAAILTAPRVAAFPDKSGTFAYTSDVPTTMVGVGGGHKGGSVPDTGASGAGTDYLARDATWKTAATFSAPAYQPILPNCVFFPSPNTTGARNVQIGGSGVTGNIIFFGTTASTGPFTEYTGTISLPAGSTVWSYQAKMGYTNSSIVSYTNPNP